MSKGRGLRLIRPVAAAREARAVGRVSAIGAGIGGGFGFGRVIPSPDALFAVAQPRVPAIPAERAGELAPIPLP